MCICGLGCSGGYYVALNGDDSNAGTREEALGSIEKAIEVVQPRESIFLRGGTYHLSDTIAIEKDGVKGRPIKLWACPGEEVVLDFSNAGDSSNGFEIEGSYWHLKGLVIQKAGEKGIHCEGSHNVFERLITRINGDGGIKLDDGAANNLVLNCDSYLNYDKPTHGTNADGFQAKHGLGKSNAFKGCRAWNNSDDGFDFMEAGNAIRVEDCWAWSNGVNIWKDPDFEGNGVGFKLGERDGPHVIIRCLVWKNGRTGFNIEENTSSVTMYHNTAWKNPRNYKFDDPAPNPHVLRNNISFQGKVAMMEKIDHRNNSWNGGFEVTRDDFISLDDSGMSGPRKPDGGLPDCDFLKLATGSDLIDNGVDVGLSFSGSAPDLGAFER
jgi:hypothetical protein